MSKHARAAGGGTRGATGTTPTNLTATSAPSLALTATLPSNARGVSDFSKSQGRDAAAPSANASGGGGGGGGSLPPGVLAPLRVLQSNLGALRGLAALDASALGAESFAQTESLLFGSREAARALQTALKHAEHARPAGGAQAQADAQPHPQAQAQATRQLLAALSSAIEKAASILLAKHKQHEMDERARPHVTSSDAGSSSGNAGGKRKQGASMSNDTQFSSTHKRVRGAVIAPPPSSATAAGAAPLSGPAAQPAPPLTLEQRVEAALTRVQSLQQLQEQLQRNAETLTPPPAPGTKSNLSGSSTPSRRGAPLRSTHTQPLSIGSSRPAPSLPHEPEEADAEARMDDEPMSARSDASNDSMSSEAHSEAAVAQRANMLATLAENVRALQKRIRDETQRQQSGPDVLSAPSAAVGDSSMLDSSTLGDPGLHDSLSDASSKPFAAPASVPRLDLARLTSQVGALETLLQRGVDTMAALAAMQEREMRKRAIRHSVRNKGGSTALHPEGAVASIFPAPAASSFAARPFGEGANAGPLGATSGGGGTTNATAASDANVYTEAARGQGAVTAALAKLSDVPRASAAVFGSAPRFPDASDAKKASNSSKVAQRKALYDKYAAVQADLARALLDAERMRSGQTEDPVLAALNATRPRLVQNVVMAPAPSPSPDPTTRSAAALAAERERRLARERTQALGPGAYEAQSALTQRRVQGMASWGPGPGVDADGEDAESLAPTQRLVTRSTATGTLGPGAYPVREELTTRRVTGPRYIDPALAAEETVQAVRARAMLAEKNARAAQLEAEKDYENLDVTVRRKVPALGSLIAPEPGSSPSTQQARAEYLVGARTRQRAKELAEREAKMEALAQQRRVTQMRLLTSRRAAFLQAEEEKLAKTAQLLAAGLGPDGLPLPAGLTPNFEYTLPRKPAFRYAAPKALQDLADETTKHGQSARKRSTLQLARQAKQAQAAEQKMERVEAKQHEFHALRASQSVYSMARMQGRPNPQSVDERDYDLASAKDFAQKAHVRGDDWSRAAARPVAENGDLDPEIDDVIGGQEGDVLDLAPKDTLVRRRVPSHSFGPRGGPAAALGAAEAARGLQTLSDTELDYGAGAGDDTKLNPSQLYPNPDFVRKRQGAGGAIPFAKQVLGGGRSHSAGEDSDEDMEFPYLAEGNAPLDPRYGAVEPAPRATRFALRRDEFLAMHARAKEREARRLARAEGDALVLNAGTAASALVRHKPAANFSFSARHDQGGSDDELDDNEGLGLPSLGGARKRGGPAEYAPRYGFKDPLTRSSHFSRDTGRPALDSSDDELEGRADQRDFLGGQFASRNPFPAKQCPGADFGRSKGRVDQQAEDREDFPDTHAEGDRLDLHPRLSQSGPLGGVNMARATGRPEGPDALDLEELQEGARLDLHPEKARRHVPGTGGGGSFAKQSGRPETDAIDQELDGPRGPDLEPNSALLAARTPVARFPSAARFGPDGQEEALLSGEAQSDLDPLHSLTRRRAPAALFGTAAARAELASESNTREESANQVARDHAGRVAMHTPGVDFAATTGRTDRSGAGQNPSVQTVLQTELARDFVAGDTPAHGFGTAAARAAAAPSLGASQLLALNPESPRGSNSGASFPQALRPGAGLHFGRQEGSVLYPESSDPLVQRRAPEWSFEQAKRFGGNLDAWLDRPDRQLSLHPSHAGVEARQPHASLSDHDRFPAGPPALSDEQLLALDPRDDAVRARHPRAVVGTEARWEAAIVADAEARQSHLHPNIDSVRPQAPRASLDLSGRAGAVSLERAPALGADYSDEREQGLRLDPRPVLPRSPAAHITSSQRGSGPQAGRPAEPYYNTALRLHPRVDFSSGHPRAPAHSIAERLFDSTYVPSAADIAAARKRRLQQEARDAAAVAGATFSEDEDDTSLLADAVSDLSLDPHSFPPVARVLGPSRSPARGRPITDPTEADLFELDQSAASLSLSLDGGAEDASSASLGLPDTGVVANAASLLAARRERQAREAARLQQKEEARAARKLERQRERERERQMERDSPLAPSGVVAMVLPGSQRAAGAESQAPRPSASEPGSAFAGAPSSFESTPASPPSPSQPLRRTVQFALEPQVREFVVDRPEPQAQPQPQPRPAQTKQPAGPQPKPKAATAVASAQPPQPVRKAKPVVQAAAVASAVGSRATRPTSAAPSR